MVQQKMEEIRAVQDTDYGVIKAKTGEEFLVHIGAKKEEIEWNPMIVNEPLSRSQSFICKQYDKPACFRKKPKTVPKSAWSCDSQATRQLAMISRQGPRVMFLNSEPGTTDEERRFPLRSCTTQSLGLCHRPLPVPSL